MGLATHPAATADRITGFLKAGIWVPSRDRTRIWSGSSSCLLPVWPGMRRWNGRWVGDSDSDMGSASSSSIFSPVPSQLPLGTDGIPTGPRGSFQPKPDQRFHKCNWTSTRPSTGLIVSCLHHVCCCHCHFYREQTRFEIHLAPCPGSMCRLSLLARLFCCAEPEYGWEIAVFIL